MSRAVVGALVPLVVLAGCGGSDGADGSDEPDDGGSPSASSSGTAGDDGTDGAPGAPDYLPVPDGVELTEPGTELGLREPAFGAWMPRQDLVGVVAVAVTRIERTTVRRSFAGFDLSPAEQASTPYFVHAVAVNQGDTDLGGRQLPLYAVDQAGRLVPPTGVDQGFEQCPGGLLPAVFAPDDRARSCLIFLVPDGGRIEQVMFRPPEGVVPLTWSGDEVRYGEKKDRKPGGKKRGRPDRG